MKTTEINRRKLFCGVAAAAVAPALAGVPVRRPTMVYLSSHQVGAIAEPMTKEAVAAALREISWVRCG